MSKFITNSLCQVILTIKENAMSFPSKVFGEKWGGERGKRIL